MAIDFSLIDYGVIVIYFVLLFIVGYIAKKKVATTTDYFLAGRRLTLPIFVATFVSTWYGGILGVGELSFNYGIVNWLTQGFFWYLSYLFFAFFLANRIRKSNLYTVPDQLERFYDNKARFLGSIFTFLMVTPAPYVASLGIVFGLLFDWPAWVGILLVTLVMLFYTLRGGFVGVIYTDLIQFVLMMGGIALVIPFAISQFGGVSWLMQNVPVGHFTLTGGWSVQLILVWGFIAFWTLVDPGFYQRCYAAKDSKIPRKGILISIIFWMLFDVCTTFIGIYARAAMPGIDPTTALPVFASTVLPVVLKGLFFTGLIATIMSTIDSFALLGAMSIAHDLYHKILRKEASDRQVLRMTKFGVVIVAAFSLILALFFDSIVALWYTIGTVGISAMLVPMLIGFFYKGRKSGYAAVLSMISGAVTSTTWLIHGWVNRVDGWPSYFLGLEPLYPGLVVSLCVFIVVNWFRKWI